MTSLVVVGVGSPFGKDALGLDIIDALSRNPPAIAGCTSELVKADRPGVRLLDLVRGREAVVLIDAMASGADPGTVQLLNRRQLKRFGCPCSSHSLGVAEVLDLGERLRMLPPRLRLIGVELTSELTEQLLNRVVRLICKI